MPPALLLVPAAFLAFDAYCLADLWQAGEVRYFDRPVWSLLILCLTPFAGISYLYIGRVR